MKENMCIRCNIACLDNLRLGRRIKIYLEENDIHLLSELLNKTPEEISNIPQIGSKGTHAIRTALRKVGYDLLLGDLPHQILDLNDSIEKIKFNSVRAKCLLQNAGIETIKELINFTECEFLKIRNCGVITLRDIKTAMWKYGLEFRDEDNEKDSRATGTRTQ
jgi:DNA-directed RNA polymerase alpha subunit